MADEDLDEKAEAEARAKKKQEAKAGFMKELGDLVDSKLAPLKKDVEGVKDRQGSIVKDIANIVKGKTNDGPEGTGGGPGEGAGGKGKGGAPGKGEGLKFGDFFPFYPDYDDEEEGTPPGK